MRVWHSAGQNLVYSQTKSGHRLEVHLETCEYADTLADRGLFVNWVFGWAVSCQSLKTNNRKLNALTFIFLHVTFQAVYDRICSEMLDAVRVQALERSIKR